MPTAFDRLRTIASQARPATSARERRIMAATGLAVAHQPCPDPEVAALRLELSRLTQPLDIPGLVEFFNTAFCMKQRSSRGHRLYRVPIELLLAPVEAAARENAGIAAIIAGYRSAWLTDPGSCALAAVYAMAENAAIAAGLAKRELGAPGPRTMMDAYFRAREALDATAEAGQKHWLWSRANLSLSFIRCRLRAGDAANLPHAFERVQCLDPFEFGIYEERAEQLSPLWLGSGKALAGFSDSAVLATAAEFGTTLYARIYTTALTHSTVRELDPDLNAIRQGFVDWLDRFPSQPLANRAASVAVSIGDDWLLRELFRNHIHTIHLDEWIGEDQVRRGWEMASRGRRRK